MDEDSGPGRPGLLELLADDDESAALWRQAIETNWLSPQVTFEVKLVDLFGRRPQVKWFPIIPSGSKHGTPSHLSLRHFDVEVVDRSSLKLKRGAGADAMTVNFDALSPHSTGALDA